MVRGLLEETQKPQEGEKRVRGGSCLEVLCSSCKDALVFFPHFNRLHKAHPEMKPQKFPSQVLRQTSIKMLSSRDLSSAGNTKLSQTAVWNRTESAGQTQERPWCCSPPFARFPAGCRPQQPSLRPLHQALPGTAAAPPLLQSRDPQRSTLEGEKSLLLTSCLGFQGRI